MKRHFSVLTAVICVTVLFGGTVPASAGGFEEKTVEELDENITRCDFDGDGIYETEADVVPGQTLLVKEQTIVDGRGRSRSVGIARGTLEYIAVVEGEEISVFVGPVALGIVTREGGIFTGARFVGPAAYGGTGPGVVELDADFNFSVTGPPGVLCRDINPE